MPEFLHPGVFILETSFRGKPIEGVATSTAGFVGRAPTGPVGVATLVTSFTQFVREFGQPYSSPQNLGEYLAHAVKGFFDNGGLRAYIVRVLGAGAAFASNAFFRGNVLRLPATSTVRGPTTSLPVSSLRGVHATATIDIFVRPSPAVPFGGSAKYSTTVQSYDAASKIITLAAGLPPGAVLDPANTYIVVDGAKPAAGGPTLTSLDRGASGNDLGVAFRPADLPPVRLQTKKVRRATPVIGSGIAGPAAHGGTVITFAGPTADLIRQLRNGDTVRLDDGNGHVEPGTIDAANGIGPATVNYNIVAGGAGNINAGGAIFFLSRGGPPDIAGQGVKLFTLPPLPATVAFGANSVSLPHAVAALLRNGDKLTAHDGANADIAFVVQGVVFAGNAQNPTTLTLVNPAPPDAVNHEYGRLVVTDASGLNAPARRNVATNVSAPEPVYVTDGINSESATVVFVDVPTNTVLYDNNNSFAWNSLALNSWTTLESLQVAHAGDTTLSVASTSSFYLGASLKFDDGTAPQYFVVSGVDSGARTVTLGGGLVIATNNGYVDLNPTARAAFLQVLELDALVYQAGTVVETFNGLTWNNDPAADSFKKYYAARINDTRSGSAFVNVASPLLADDDGSIAKSPSTPDGFRFSLINGGDGAAPTNIDLIGQDNGPGNRTGIQSLTERDDIAIVAVPGVSDVAVQEALITHCELLKYRFAVLDGIPHASDVAKIQAHRNNYDTKYAGEYEPWLQTLDLTTGNTLLVPPSGHVIGIYARSDNTRGVHKAPANEVVQNVLDLEYQFGNGEQDVLNPVGVNLIRSFTGRGIRVWGARTLSSDQEWKYVNVRRLFIYLEHSIDIGTQWVVFEPNNEELWARVKSTIEAFLFGVWKTGALMGTKPEEAYFVKVDRTTMTQDDIDNGRLVVLIGVSPTFPAEFVIFKIGQFTASAPAS